jgi:hypothetical protein
MELVIVEMHCTATAFALGIMESVIVNKVNSAHLIGIFSDSASKETCIILMSSDEPLASRIWLLLVDSNGPKLLEINFKFWHLHSGLQFLFFLTHWQLVQFRDIHLQHFFFEGGKLAGNGFLLRFLEVEGS